MDPTATAVGGQLPFTAVGGQLPFPFLMSAAAHLWATLQASGLIGIGGGGGGGGGGGVGCVGGVGGCQGHDHLPQLRQGHIHPQDQV